MDHRKEWINSHLIELGSLVCIFGASVPVVCGLLADREARRNNESRPHCSRVELFGQTSRPYCHNLVFQTEWLLCEGLRADHLKFNKFIHDSFPGQGVIRTTSSIGGNPVYVVPTHEAAVKVLSDDVNFSSNPWSDRAIVTLNTTGAKDHNRILRVLKRFYMPRTVSESVRESFDSIADRHFSSDILADSAANRVPFDVYKAVTRLVMHTSLFFTGLVSADEISDSVIDQFIEFNNAAVTLMAPIGGIGHPVDRFSQKSKLIWGILTSIPTARELASEVGVLTAIRLLNPVAALFNRAPFTQAYRRSDLLALMPRYFVALWRLMKKANPECPAGALFNAATVQRTLSVSEAILTCVQLMVNMTTANLLLNLADASLKDQRLSHEFDPNSFVNEGMRLLAPLQRVPRRAVRDTIVAGVKIPRQSIVLVFVGAANTDPNVFAKPFELSLSNLTAGGNLATGPIGFGFGLHRCLGQHLVTEVASQFVSRLWAMQESYSLSIGKASRLTDVDVGNFGFNEYEICVDVKH